MRTVPSINILTEHILRGITHSLSLPTFVVIQLFWFTVLYPFFVHLSPHSWWRRVYPYLYPPIILVLGLPIPLALITGSRLYSSGDLLPWIQVHDMFLSSFSPLSLDSGFRNLRSELFELSSLDDSSFLDFSQFKRISYLNYLTHRCC